MHCPIDLVVPITCDQSSRSVEMFWLGSWGQSWRSSGSCVAEVAECLQLGSARYSSPIAETIFISLSLDQRAVLEVIFLVLSREPKKLAATSANKL